MVGGQESGVSGIGSTEAGGDIVGRIQGIRAIALGLIQHGSRLFVSEGFDPVKEDTFYRALGGGIEFGETSLDALKREFQEELQAELTNIRYLGCLENLFTYDGKPGHELVQLYRCDFADKTFYQREQIPFSDSDQTYMAYWIERDRFHSGELRLVPPACLQYLD
ncbi:NUDIX hydrolase [Stenomitos frigidus]|uniref:NUDIX hydrolase n=1 Tax=Stenomitos frigidus TaxID=1886765 RepID=UPI001FE6926B|nr:NUDIX hydrolase [Stenomitos frigidus]